MKAEFELTIDKNGEPLIKFLHHDKDKSLEQKLLGVFIEKVKKNGLKLQYTGGLGSLGTSESWERYEIRVDTSKETDSTPKAKDTETLVEESTDITHFTPFDKDYVDVDGHISEDLYLAIHRLYHSKFRDDIVYCGSLGLVLHGVLDRKIEDIDIRTIKNYYGTGELHDIMGASNFVAGSSESHRTLLDKTSFLCFKIDYRGINIDVFYSKTNVEYNYIHYRDMRLKVEIPCIAVAQKQFYVLTDENKERVDKHRSDLKYLEKYKDRIMSLSSPYNVESCVSDIIESVTIEGPTLTDDDLPF